MAIEVIVEKVPVAKQVINKMLEVESIIADMPDAKFGDDCCPLKHTFADGLYIREVTMPKGYLITSKLHKTTHPYFVLSGDVSVITPDGPIRIIAPHSGITKAGTKRILYMNEETVWITVHATKETDLEKIEDELIAKTYEELPEEIKKAFDGKEMEALPCHSQQ